MNGWKGKGIYSMKISINKMKDKIANSRAYKSLLKFANSNVVAKFIFSVIIGFMALLPTWAYFGTRWLIGPEDFWQELAILVLFGVVVGWLQIIMVIVAFVMIMSVILDT